MTEDLIQAYARISAHEFLLEILYAKWLSALPDEEAAAIVSEIKRLAKSAYVAADAAPAEELAMKVARDCALFTNPAPWTRPFLARRQCHDKKAKP